MKHYSEIYLNKFLNNRLSPVKRALCRIHLMFCPKCRKMLREIKDEQIFLGEFKRGFLEMERAYLKASSLEGVDTKQKTDKILKSSERKEK